jgi:EmrB/QacA subfamily drug resistance transporter
MSSPQPPKSPNKWLVFSLVVIGIFMSTLDGSIVNIAVPSIMRDLGVSLATIEWVVMIYLLTVTSLLLSFGRLSDLRGRRQVYSQGLALFTLGSLFCGLAGNVAWLIGSRLFQGVGAAMIMACTPALIVDVFPTTERGRALGLVGSVVALGLSAGPALGGLILHLFSWRAIFFINIPTGLITATAVFFLLKGSEADITRDETFDWPGALLLALGLGTLLLAISHCYDWGYLSPAIVSLLCLAGVAIVVLTLIESRTKHPILSLDLFRVRLFSLPMISAILLFTSLFSLIFLMPFYLLHPCGLSIDRVGLVMATIFVCLFVVSPLSGALSDRIGSRLLCSLGMGVVAIALYLLGSLPPQAPLLSIVGRLALVGLGTGIFIPPNSSAALNSVPPHRRGVASGTMAAARNLGMVLGVALSGALFNSTFYRLNHGAGMKEYRPELETIFMASFHRAIWWAMVVALLGMTISYLRGPNGTIKG